MPRPSERSSFVGEDGVVTLRGTVGSFRRRRAAVSDARAVDQGDEINDELKVRLLDEWRREDAEIRASRCRS